MRRPSRRVHPSLRATLLTLTAAALLALAGCGNPGSTPELDTSGDDDTSQPADTASDTQLEDGAQDTADAEPEALIEDLVVVANPVNALSYFVEWRTRVAASSTLSVDCGADYQHSFELSSRTDHRVFVMGLFDGAQCALEVNATSDDAEESDTATADLEVGPLPDFLPVPEVLVHEPDRVQPGSTLINLSNAFDGVPAIAAVVDFQGRYRWYHQFATDFDGADHEVFVTRDGIQTCGNVQRIPVAEIDWQGNALWSADVYSHHDCRYLDEAQTRMRILSSTENCPMGRSHSVLEISVPDGEVLWEWAMCDVWTPPVWDPDWAHLNTIESFPDEDAFLVSSRTQHSVFKIDRQSGEVVWQLGLNGDFAMAPEDHFFRQHAPEIQPDGHIVLFDNGEYEVREHSRLVELAYDETTMTAEVVWEYVPEPAIFAPIWGDADRLPNGNTLGTFGLRSTSEHTHLIEVDAQSEEVWHLRLPLNWGTYRADRVELPHGFVADD